MSQQKKQILIVLGMHRSGTSMMAGVLNQLDIPMGNALMPPRDGENEKGFWEDERIVALHESLLETLGMTWDDPRLMPDQWWSQKEVSEIKSKLKDLIVSEFLSQSIWAFKDPRTCRLMPLWHQILNDLEIEPLFIHVVRNPVDVACSLNRRDSFDQGKALLLWFVYNIEAFQATSMHRRTILSFKELLENTTVVVENIGRDLELYDSVTDKSKKAINDFVSPDLSHHNIGNAELSKIPAIFFNLFALCQNQHEGETVDFNKKVDGLVAEFMQMAMLFLPWQQLSKDIESEIKISHQYLNDINLTSNKELDLARKYLAERDKEIASLEANMVVSNRELDLAREYLSERDKAISSLEVAKVVSDEELDLARKYLAERDKAISNLEASATRFNEELERAREYLMKREKTISSLNEAMVESNGELERAREYLAERDSAILGMNADIQVLNADIQVLNKELHVERQYVVMNERSIANFDATVMELNEKLANARLNLIENTNTMDALEIEQHDLKEIIHKKDKELSDVRMKLENSCKEFALLNDKMNRVTGHWSWAIVEKIIFKGK